MSITKKGNLHAPSFLARKAYLTIGNHNSITQEIFSTSVPKSVTTAKLKAFVADPSFSALSKVSNFDIEFLAMLSPHRVETVSRDVKAGRYVLFAAPITSSEDFDLKKGAVRVVTVK